MLEKNPTTPSFYRIKLPENGAFCPHNTNQGPPLKSSFVNRDLKYQLQQALPSTESTLQNQNPGEHRLVFGNECQFQKIICHRINHCEHSVDEMPEGISACVPDQNFSLLPFPGFFNSLFAMRNRRLCLTC